MIEDKKVERYRDRDPNWWDLALHVLKDLFNPSPDEPAYVTECKRVVLINGFGFLLFVAFLVVYGVTQ